MKKIKATFTPNGDVKLEAIGFVGAACREASRPYEERLGAKTSDEPKPAMYEVQSESEGLTQT